MVDDQQEGGQKDDGAALRRERPQQNKGPIFLFLIVSLRHDLWLVLGDNGRVRLEKPNTNNCNNQN